MEAVFVKVLSMSATASVVILAVILARFLLRKAPKKYAYALWSVVAFRLLCPVSFKGFFSIFVLVGRQETPTPHPTTTMGGVVMLPDAPMVVPHEVPPVPPTGGGTAPVIPAVPTAPQTAEIDWLTVGMIVWLVGMAALLIYAVASYVRLRRRVASAIRVERNVYEADGIVSPFILGAIRPRIYIPYGVEPEALRYILAHEHCHLRRGDHVIRPLSFILLAIHWFDPLCWLVFYLSGKDMEMSCDEKVLAQGGSVRKAYSTTLLSFAEERPTMIPGPLAFGEVGVKSRIKNALKWKKPKVWVTVAAAVLSILVIAACAADPAQKDTNGDEPASEVPEDGGETEHAGAYATMEDYAEKILEDIKGSEITYPSIADGESTTKVLNAKVYTLVKEGQLTGLDPEGTLESWRFNYLVQVEAKAEDISLAGGMFEEDGWFDLEGQGGHTVVALCYPDGSYDVLASFAINDGYPYYGLHETIEESLYDWYVEEKGLELPLCVTNIPSPGESEHSFEMRRFDGDGWYIYIPATAWAKADAAHLDEWCSMYDTGSSLNIYEFEESAQSMVNHLMKNGWEKVDDGFLHVHKYSEETGEELHDYWFDKPDGGAYQVRISWDPKKIADVQEAAMEPEALQLMAKSFTVDDRFQRKPVPRVPYELWGVKDGDPVKITLRQDDKGYYWDDCWGTSNALHFFICLTNYTWEEVALAEDHKVDGTSVTMQTDYWSLTAYEDEAVLKREMDGKVTWFKGEDPEDVFSNMYSWVLRSWADELEMAELMSKQSLVIPDRGQTYMEAAAEWAQLYEETNLNVLPGSEFRYTFVKTSVKDAEDATESLREIGDIGENSWCFYTNTIFVPENARAEHWSMAGNTEDYAGNDPDVPKGAFIYGRCCTITKEADGWHGEMLGTGW